MTASGYINIFTEDKPCWFTNEVYIDKLKSLWVCACKLTPAHPKYFWTFLMYSNHLLASWCDEVLLDQTSLHISSQIKHINVWENGFHDIKKVYYIMVCIFFLNKILFCNFSKIAKVNELLWKKDWNVCPQWLYIQWPSWSGQQWHLYLLIDKEEKSFFVVVAFQEASRSLITILMRFCCTAHCEESSIGSW